jgi:hypothetical protein
MISVATFARRVPSQILRAYFERTGVALPSQAVWPVGSNKFVETFARVVEQLDEVPRAKFLSDAERIDGMSDDAGQTALLGIALDHQHLEQLRNAHARSAWMLVNEPELFRRAEEARYCDERRRGRSWSGFIGEPGTWVQPTADGLDRFKLAVREHYGSQNVHVDIFERTKASFEGEVFQLVQATIYRDGLAQDVAEFVNDSLAWRPRKPGYEAVVTYEPTSGSIEVVGDDREGRQYLARTFAHEILGAESGGSPLPLREFSLDILLRSYDFPTDPNDGIESVRLTELRLVPLDTQGERVTLECSRQASHTIWTMAAERFGTRNPLAAGWFPTKAKLLIRFHPEPGSRRSKVLPLTFTMPNGCDLKERTSRENMIGQKYLERWQLVKHV